MQRRLTSTLVLMAAVGVASGCGDQQQPLPSAPEFHTITNTLSGCDFTHINQLVQSYFSNVDRRKAVKDLVSAMAAADGVQHFSTTVKGYGFDIMVRLDTVVTKNAASDPAGDPGVGSNLVNHLILCMYDPTAESANYPTTFPEDFTVALDTSTSAHGAFGVRPGSGTDLTDATPVLSRPVSAPFSGVGPSSGAWAATLSSNAPARVLLYGRPGSTSTSYNWKALPRGATFTPPVVVAVCVNSATETTTVLNEDNVTLLPFVDAPFLVPGTCSPTSTALLDSNGPATLARSLIRMGASLFRTRALWAAALSPGGLGGTIGGLHSEYGPSEIDHVKLAFKQQPTSTTVFTKITPAVTVVDTAFLATGVKKSIPNVTITITAVNNNGKTVVLGGLTTKVTDGTGLTTFDGLTLSKSGGYQLVASGAVGGRSAIPVPQAASVKFNIAPK